ncbi:tRNA pseudouridine(38-40) synthase TruA [Sulfurospirillum sp. 1612]|uniref:tRNA pseudouridine(38-40) synthase TruA n=1 Tax=Sulfurospirillum sp. 1612 TaxID=3094835 RepID=UPI002F944D40
MQRIKLTLCYDGAKFFGSQTQNNNKMPTIMGSLQDAFSLLGITSHLQASGRTDRNVHALHQVCHIDIPLYFKDLMKLKKSLNKLVKPYIYIEKIEHVSADFHARFSAKMRLYRYIISHNQYNPTQADYVLFLPKLDASSMHHNAQYFVGTHDFGYFKKKGTPTKTDIRTIYKAGAYAYRNHTIIYFLGSSFLRTQVRFMCDFLLKIEQQSATQEDLRKQINQDARINMTPAPAQGLYLCRIFY